LLAPDEPFLARKGSIEKRHIVQSKRNDMEAKYFGALREHEKKLEFLMI